MYHGPRGTQRLTSRRVPVIKRGMKLDSPPAVRHIDPSRQPWHNAGEAAPHSLQRALSAADLTTRKAADARPFYPRDVLTMHALCSLLQARGHLKI